jgi:Tol biopolymer transport system component
VERKLTTEEGDSWWAVWTPDGASVVTHLQRPSEEWLELITKPANGSRPAEPLTQLRANLQPFSFTGDGAILAFQRSFNEETGNDIWTLAMTGDRTPRPLLCERFHEVQPALSPDGKWIAYASNETERYEVSVRPHPGPGGVIRISADGGWEPVWSPDGTELYYRDLTGRKILAVSFDTAASSRRPGRPRVVAEGPFRGTGPFGRNYDLGPDGRFLVILQGEPPPPPTDYRVVLNWFEELQRLVPTSQGRRAQ